MRNTESTRTSALASLPFDGRSLNGKYQRLCLAPETDSAADRADEARGCGGRQLQGFAGMVTHRFKLADIEAAYDLFSHQRDGVMKVALRP